ncbi:MAG: hypothetical protein ABI721_00435 [Candidatus Dojkabacteria bacterium]
MNKYNIEDRTKFYKKKYYIPTTRLKNHDYSAYGMYFITICTKYRGKYFGIIKNNKMYLSTMGKIAYKYWNEIPTHYPNVILDEFIVMPDHMHGVLIFMPNVMHNIETHNCASLTNDPNSNRNHNCASLMNDLISNCNHNCASPTNDPKPKPNRNCASLTNNNEFKQNKFGQQTKNLAAIIRGYKSSVKRYANINEIEFNWQQLYYCKIIKTQNSFKNIQRYIINNVYKHS